MNMSQSSNKNFGFANLSANYYETLDSPMASLKNVSRFLKLADRTCSSISGTSLGFNESTIINQTNTMMSPPVSSTFINDKNQDFNKFNLSILHESPTNNDEIEMDDTSQFHIFQTFYELSINLTDSLETFDLMNKFDDTCETNMFVMNKLLEDKCQSESLSMHRAKFSNLMRLERNIWRLLKALMSDRFLCDSNAHLQMEIEEDFGLRLSDDELVRREIEHNSTLREMQIVIDWLESIYDEDLVDKIDFFSDGPQYWENTLHILKNKQQKPNLNGFSSQCREFCSEMDPDAPLRNGLALCDEDKEDESRLFYYLFKLIRSGRLQEGKHVAERLGFFWLSAALNGWILHHDPNYNEQQESLKSFKQLQPVQGNPYRDLWKLTSWKCSKMEGTNLYERAIFAVFSGNRSALMPLCSNWIDKLWAYYKCSLDVQLENLLIGSNISKPNFQPRRNIDLPDAYWDNRLSVEEIFHELETNVNILSSGFNYNKEEEYYHLIVKAIVLRKIDSLIDHFYEWSKTIQTNREQRSKSTLNGNFSLKLNKFSNNEEEVIIQTIEPNLLRLFSHCVICLKQMNAINSNQFDLCYEILEIYINFLIEYKWVHLIAFYSGFLPESIQIKTFATLLETIDDIDYRIMCIVVAKNAKLNLPAILSQVVENIRLNKTHYQLVVSKSIPTVNFGHLSKNDVQVESKINAKPKTNLLSTDFTEEDVRKIRALEWLLLDDEAPQYFELLWQGNSLIRSFLLEHKVDQALEAFNQMPKDIINRAYHEWKSSIELSSELDIENVFREYFCHQTYFDAQEAFKKWHNYLYTSKPREPIKPRVAFTRFADRHQFDQKVKQFEKDMEIWISQIKQQAENTSKKLLDFLCFPEGIWSDCENLNEFQELAEKEKLVVDATELDSENVPISTEIVELLDESSEETLLQTERALIKKQIFENRRLEWTVSRTNELDGLRRIYVPQFIFLLHSVHSDAGNRVECLKVADILADESMRLYATFTPEQLADFLAKIREASIENLKHNSDPLGYVKE